MNWKLDLNGMLGTGRTRLSRAQQEEIEFQKFLTQTVMPAYTQIVEELAKYEREVVVRNTGTAALLSVRHGNVEEITFRVFKRDLPVGFVPYAEVRTKERKGLKVSKSDINFHDGPYTMDKVKQEDVLKTFMEAYRAAMER